MKRRPKIGLAGCGHWGTNILRDLLSLQCEVHVAEPLPEARHRARALGATACVPSVDRWEAGRIDGYIIATPASTHLALIDSLLPAGKPIFCEKPLSDDVAAARVTVSRAERTLFVMHKWRYHPAIEALEELARSSAYGDVREIHTRRLQWSLAHPDKDAAWDLAPHDLSIAYAIARRLPAPHAAHMRLNDRGKAISLTGVLADTAGPTVHLHVATNWPQIERSVHVIFDHGAAVLRNPYADHLEVYPCTDGILGEVQAVSIAQDPPLRRELQCFVDHLRGGPPPRTSAREGLEVIEAIEALRRLSSSWVT